VYPKFLNELLLATQNLKKRSGYGMHYCKLCGALYGRHFTDCPCDTIPKIVAEMQNAVRVGTLFSTEVDDVPDESSI
jgi:hypothetical protein